MPADPQDDLLREQDVGPEEIALVVVNASAEALVRYFEMPWWKRLRPNREWAYTMAKTAQVQSVELVQFNLRRRGLVPDEGPVDS